MAKAKGNGTSNGDGRRAAIQAATAVLAHLIQEHEEIDHFRILIGVDGQDCRLEITKLSKWRLA